jgi:hypothetical protein
VGFDSLDSILQSLDRNGRIEQVKLRGHRYLSVPGCAVSVTPERDDVHNDLRLATGALPGGLRAYAARYWSHTQTVNRLVGELHPDPDQGKRHCVPTCECDFVRVAP